MELRKIHEMNDGELKSQEARVGEQLFRIRFQKSLGNVEGIGKLREFKKDVARIKTVMRQRVLGQVIAPIIGTTQAKKTRKAKA